MNHHILVWLIQEFTVVQRKLILSRGIWFFGLFKCTLSRYGGFTCCL